ncbi:hypothetical protein [Segetibacter aerophilus]|uniref:Uncharacterized protein n=1 Tax=Segetibacter aerophilus TaxID=670293 RepID=A0A512BC85_9BACT|nr:hypothetical protein [Segetibacter aerophilus]GEO09457.1 hypothetical protein SAE01_19530 [Segetibacter aerophilus]
MLAGVYTGRILSILLFFNVACISNRAKEQHQYYYYPQKNVYYDPVKKNFWYSLNGARSWNKFSDSNAVEPVALGAKVLISSTDSEVYKNNESHRKLYSGALLAINVTDTTGASPGPEVAGRTVVQKKKITARKKPVEQKPKKGLGKFINKIFGKH